LKAHAKLVQIVVVTLNWLTLGYPKHCPQQPLIGSTISTQQHDMLERLESLVGYFLAAQPVSFAELGRAGEKLAKICDAAIRLPTSVSDVGWDEMASFLDILQHDFDPYGSETKSSDPAVHPDDAEAESSCSLQPHRTHGACKKVGFIGRLQTHCM
jgi:hypothetical protein